MKIDIAAPYFGEFANRLSEQGLRLGYVTVYPAAELNREDAHLLISYEAYEKLIKSLKPEFIEQPKETP